MCWLFSMVLTSVMGAGLVVWIVRVLFGDILGPLAGSAKNSIFVGTSTAITTGLGIHKAKKVAQKLRPGQKEVDAPIKNLLKPKRPK